jgi:chromosome segregation ATPase
VEEAESRSTTLHKEISTLRQSAKTELINLTEHLEDSDQQHTREIQTLKNTLASRNATIADHRSKQDSTNEDIERMRNDHSLALHSLKTSTGREITTMKQKYEGVVDSLARATAEVEQYRNQASVRDRETARAVKESQDLGRKLRGQVWG